MNSNDKITKPTAASNLMQLMSFTADKAMELSDANNVLGDRIEIDGITIIPVSKVSAGFAGGGANMVNHTVKKQNTPSGSGAKVTVTPLSFLVIADGQVNVININAPEKGKGNLLAKIMEAVKGLKKDKKEKTEETEEITLQETEITE